MAGAWRRSGFWVPALAVRVGGSHFVDGDVLLRGDYRQGPIHGFLFCDAFEKGLTFKMGQTRSPPKRAHGSPLIPCQRGDSQVRQIAVRYSSSSAMARMSASESFGSSAG